MDKPISKETSREKQKRENGQKKLETRIQIPFYIFLIFFRKENVTN